MVKLRLLEADFAQIEHINQIIYNSRSHTSWACFDTHYLLERYIEDGKVGRVEKTDDDHHKGYYNAENPGLSYITGSFKDVRYDFMIVNIEKVMVDGEHEGYLYSFEIRNALWDGTYKITKSKSNDSDKNEYFEKGKVTVTKDPSDDNIIKFKVMGEHCNRVRVCFKMNISGHGRTLKTTSIRIDNPTEYTHQFDVQRCEKGQVLTHGGNPVSDVDVSIEPVDKNGRPMTDGIPSKVIRNIQNGEFKMCYGAVKTPGDYYVLMKVIDDSSGYDNSRASQMICIHKIQKEKVVLDWGEASQYEGVKKGCIKTFEIKLNIEDVHGLYNETLDKKLANIPFTVTSRRIGGARIKQTCRPTTNSKGEWVINPTVSFRGYYEDTSYLDVELSPTHGYGTFTQSHIIRHKWFKAYSYDELKSEVENAWGADWIFIYPKAYLRTATTTITRNVTIAGMTGTNRPTILGAGGTIFTLNSSNPSTDGYMKVNLVGIGLIHASTAVRMITGCRLLIDRCYFYDNTNINEHERGCSIYMPTTDYSISHQKEWKTEIRNSYFYNNKGNEIQSIGTTYIHHNLFKTTSKDCLQQPEVKVVSVRAGNVTYKNNKSYIDIPFTNKYDAMPTNHSYAKALAYVDKNATFNGKGPSDLGRNDSLPLFGGNWNNEAYTRACYYYPYDDVKTHIVCSPEKGKERRATGHASAYTNWVFYDGYYFTRLEKSLGNMTKPWTEKELTIPDDIGIYDEIHDRFIERYDPKYSNNKSTTSEV